MKFGNNTDTSFHFGVQVAQKACQAPFKRLIYNKLGTDPGLLLEQALARPGFGYNANTNKVVDLIACGIIDPTKVVTSSLIYGSSIASIMLSTDFAVLHHND
jgi:chaperonin GroEL